MISDIFGHFSNRFESLIASKNFSEYVKKLNPFLEKWKDFKSDKGITFSEYFNKNKSRKIYENVIKPNQSFLSENVILNDYFKDETITNYITTNEIESQNKSIKVRKFTKKNYSFSELINLLKQYVISQKNNSILALRNSGDYELAGYYRKFKIRPDVWYGLNTISQNRKIDSYFKILPIKENENEKNIEKLLKKYNQVKQIESNESKRKRRAKKYSI